MCVFGLDEVYIHVCIYCTNIYVHVIFFLLFFSVQMKNRNNNPFLFLLQAH